MKKHKTQEDYLQDHDDFIIDVSEVVSIIMKSKLENAHFANKGLSLEEYKNVVIATADEIVKYFNEKK